jgi:hypothetical protein
MATTRYPVSHQVLSNNLYLFVKLTGSIISAQLIDTTTGNIAWDTPLPLDAERVALLTQPRDCNIWTPDWKNQSDILQSHLGKLPLTILGIVFGSNSVILAFPSNVFVFALDNGAIVDQWAEEARLSNGSDIGLWCDTCSVSMKADTAEYFLQDSKSNFVVNAPRHALAFNGHTAVLVSKSDGKIVAKVPQRDIKTEQVGAKQTWKFAIGEYEVQVDGIVFM